MYQTVKVKHGKTLDRPVSGPLDSPKGAIWIIQNLVKKAHDNFKQIRLTVNVCGLSIHGVGGLGQQPTVINQ